MEILIDNIIVLYYYNNMWINKDYKLDKLKKDIFEYIFFLVIFLIFVLVTKLYIIFLVLILFSILWLINILFCHSTIFEIKLYDEYFCLITLNKTKKINYNEFNVKFIDRYLRPMIFIIHSNEKKYKVAYTEENHNKIRIILIKSNSKFSINHYENMINQFKIKPGNYD